MYSAGQQERFYNVVQIHFGRDAFGFSAKVSARVSSPHSRWYFSTRKNRVDYFPRQTEFRRFLHAFGRVFRPVYKNTFQRGLHNAHGQRPMASLG